jgi:hypothetical protein
MKKPKWSEERKAKILWSSQIQIKSVRRSRTSPTDRNKWTQIRKENYKKSEMEEEIEKPVECPRNRMKRMRTILRQQLANKYFKSVRKNTRDWEGKGYPTCHLFSLDGRGRSKRKSGTRNGDNTRRADNCWDPHTSAKLKKKNRKGIRRIANIQMERSDS